MSKRQGIRALLAVVVVTLFVTPALKIVPFAEKQCPPGYEKFEEHEEFDALENEGICVSTKHPEPFWEVELRQREWMSARQAPFESLDPGAFAAAVNERAQLAAKPPKISGTGGAWTPYGTGPLLGEDPYYTDLGISRSAGRIDNFAYDQNTGRLFATKGTGGIWMSTNLGDSWTSIGDNLPSQITAAVALARGGRRIVALSGDPSLGSGQYTGFGAFYSDDLGATWTKAAGIPDGNPAFAAEVDPLNTDIVYAATFKGLYRSSDAGATWQNVMLPTGCTDLTNKECHLANVVTDVVVRQPGGVSPVLGGTSNGTTSPVLAVVGWRAGRRLISGTSVPESPNNGIYRSDTGEVGRFVKVETTGFAQQDRIGRIEITAASGPQQNHNFVYAIVQDAVALNGGLEVLDTPEGTFVQDPRPIGPVLPVLGAKLGQLGGTVLHGVYVSPDFGTTWTLMGDDNTISKNIATGSALVVVGQAIGYEPGVQAWYNLFIAPDPTLQTPEGIPTRLVFGLEEVWQNEVVGQPMVGPTSFKVIGRYFSGESCIFLDHPTPECPTDRPPTYGQTTHPDQHAALWIPDANGGVTLAVGNDGGFYRQHVAAGQELNNGGWGAGKQEGFHTLLPYDVAMAKDGTVWAGLQDNGHLKIEPSGKQIMTYGGDGTFAEVNPDDSRVAYSATPGASARVTTDGGITWRGMAPPVTNTRFVNAFEMDPTNANHLVTGGRQIVESIWGPDTGLSGSEWQRVFDLGTLKHPGDPTAVAAAADPAHSLTAIDVQGASVYVAFCGPCTQYAGLPFDRGIATNVGGALPPRTLKADGWHIAAANGLPNRFIMGLAIDPFNPNRIYVALGGYSVRWLPPGMLNDQNQRIGTGHVFVSDDAGQNFRDISGNLPDVPVTSIVLRGKQLIVGTDVGVFATDSRGGTTYAVLGAGLPVVPISTINLQPGNCNKLVAATYGRGVYTFAFDQKLPGNNPCDGGGGGGVPVTDTFVPAERIHDGVKAFWGGSQGYADSHVTMSLAVPLGASRLSFWTWYNLEDGFDWGYVLVSADGGTTWTSLLTTGSDGSGTSAIDPIGTVGALGGNKKYPNGFTGASGTQPTFTGQELYAPKYSDQSADISSYAGRTVLLRFAYTSDPATDLEGFYVDNVRVLGLTGNVLWQDQVETIGTWSPGGTPGFRLVTKAQ